MILKAPSFNQYQREQIEMAIKKYDGPKQEEIKAELDLLLGRLMELDSRLNLRENSSMRFKTAIAFIEASQEKRTGAMKAIEEELAV